MEPFCAERLIACDRRLNDLRSFMLAQFTATEKAINLARGEMDRRLEGMNEFREQLTTQAGTLLDTKTYAADHKAMAKEIEALREWKSRTEGERSRTVVISWIAIIISLVSTVVIIIQRTI